MTSRSEGPAASELSGAKRKRQPPSASAAPAAGSTADTAIDLDTDSDSGADGAGAADGDGDAARVKRRRSDQTAAASAADEPPALETDEPSEPAVAVAVTLTPEVIVIAEPEDGALPDGVDGFFCELCDEPIWSLPICKHLTSTLHNLNKTLAQQSGASAAAPPVAPAAAAAAPAAAPAVAVGPADPQLLMHVGSVGYRLLTRMGWDARSGLGRRAQGRLYPVPTQLRRDRVGLGEPPPHAIAALRREVDAKLRAVDPTGAASAAAARDIAPSKVSELRITHFPAHSGTGELSAAARAAVEPNDRTTRRSRGSAAASDAVTATAVAAGSAAARGGVTKRQRVARRAYDAAMDQAIRSVLNGDDDAHP